MYRFIKYLFNFLIKNVYSVEDRKIIKSYLSNGHQDFTIGQTK